jgi:large subunit ribosomal protein L30
MADAKFVRITLVRSPIGYQKYQRVTAETLGLRKLNSTVIHRISPAITGMINQISHLLLVEDVDAAEGEKAVAERAALKQQRTRSAGDQQA